MFYSTHTRIRRELLERALQLYDEVRLYPLRHLLSPTSSLAHSMFTCDYEQAATLPPEYDTTIAVVTTQREGGTAQVREAGTSQDPKRDTAPSQAQAPGGEQVPSEAASGGVGHRTTGVPEARREENRESAATESHNSARWVTHLMREMHLRERHPCLWISLFRKPLVGARRCRNPCLRVKVF